MTIPPNPHPEQVEAARKVFAATIAHVCRVIECGSFLDSQADDALFAKAVVRRLKQETFDSFAKSSSSEIVA